MKPEKQAAIDAMEDLAWAVMKRQTYMRLRLPDSALAEVDGTIRGALFRWRELTRLWLDPTGQIEAKRRRRCVHCGGSVLSLPLGGYEATQVGTGEPVCAHCVVTLYAPLDSSAERAR